MNKANLVDTLIGAAKTLTEGEPSVLRQLSDTWRDQQVQGGGSARQVPRSRPTINAGVVALLMEINQTSRRQWRDMNARPEHPSPFPWVDRADTSEGIALMFATNATIDSDDPVEMDAWREVLAGWAARARVELRLDESRPVNLRAPCPDCTAPSLAVEWVETAPGSDEWYWSRLDCSSCQASFPRRNYPDVLNSVPTAGRR